MLQWCHTLSAWVLSRYPGCLSPSTDVHISLIGSSKLSVGVSVDSWPSVLAHDEVATYPGSTQPSPSDRHHHSQFCLSSTRNRVLRARCSERNSALFPSHSSSYKQGALVLESGRPLTETTCWWQEVGPPWIIAADWIAILGQPCSHLLVPWESSARCPTREDLALPGLRSDVRYVWCHLWMIAKLCIIGFAEWLHQSHSLTHYCGEPMSDLRWWYIGKERLNKEVKNMCAQKTYLVCVWEIVFWWSWLQIYIFFPLLQLCVVGLVVYVIQRGKTLIIYDKVSLMERVLFDFGVLYVLLLDK